MTLLFILISYGVCNIIIFGSIFEWFRTLTGKLGQGPYSFHKLFSCFMCLGTWVGFALSYIMIHLGYTHLTPMGSVGIKEPFLIIFLNGVLTSAGVWLVHTTQEALERAFVKKNPLD